MNAQARIAALRAEADRIESQSCTGLTATWCPVHGNCRCPEVDGVGGPGDDPNCPLHATTSSHAANGPLADKLFGQPVITIDTRGLL